MPTPIPPPPIPPRKPKPESERLATELVTIVCGEKTERYVAHRVRGALVIVVPEDADGEKRMAELAAIAQHPVEGLNLNLDGKPWSLADAGRVIASGSCSLGEMRADAGRFAAVATLKARSMLTEYIVAGLCAAGGGMVGAAITQVIRAVYARFVGI